MDKNKKPKQIEETNGIHMSHSLNKDVFKKGFSLPESSDNQIVNSNAVMPMNVTMTAPPVPAKTETPDSVEIVVDYHSEYNETDNMLRSVIGQSDVLLGDINKDLQTIRASKAMTNKYRYVTDLSASMASLLSTKISAVKELNTSRTHAIDFNMKHEKDVRAQMLASSQDDDKKIMDMYNAYMSVPMGTYMPAQPIPTMRDLTFGANPEVGRIDVNNGLINDSDIGYQNYVNNITPTQNMMRYENNPDIQTVVVYDQSNGNKWFDVINIKTGESIPNVSKPDEFLLNDTRPDLVNMIARNSNIDKVYPLIVVGQRASIQDY